MIAGIPECKPLVLQYVGSVHSCTIALCEEHLPGTRCTGHAHLTVRSIEQYGSICIASGA